MYEFDEFIQGIIPIDPRATEILLSDDGQENLTLDAIASMFPSVKTSGVNVHSPVNVGAMLGHYAVLYQQMATLPGFKETYLDASEKVAEASRQIDEVLSSSGANTNNGPAAGFIHLLKAFISPEILLAIQANQSAFEAKMAWALGIVRKQPIQERQAFMKGYFKALAHSSLDSDGKPESFDRTASLLAITRPFARTLKLSNAEFQDVIDELSQAPVTGNPERFAKHLQRRNASLRGKGRPKKKPPS